MVYFYVLMEALDDQIQKPTPPEKMQTHTNGHSDYGNAVYHEPAFLELRPDMGTWRVHEPEVPGMMTSSLVDIILYVDNRRKLRVHRKRGRSEL